MCAAIFVSVALALLVSLKSVLMCPLLRISQIYDLLINIVEARRGEVGR